MPSWSKRKDDYLGLLIGALLLVAGPLILYLAAASGVPTWMYFLLIAVNIIIPIVAMYAILWKEKGMIRRVVLNRNLLVLIVTPLILNLFNILWFPLLTNLALPHEILITFSNLLMGVIPSILSIVSVILGGVLADRFGRKKIIVYGTLFWVVGLVVMAFYSSWVWLVIGRWITVLAGISIPAALALVAESIPYERRGTGFGIYGLLSGVIGPLVLLLNFPLGYLHRQAVLNVSTDLRLRIFISLSLAGAVFVFYLRRRFLTETLGVEDRKFASSILGDFSKIFALPRVVGYLLAFTCLSVLASDLFTEYTWWYAHAVGLSPIQVGFISMVRVAVHSFSALGLLWGVLADKLGRRPFILVASVVLPWTALGYTAATTIPYMSALVVIAGFASTLGGNISTPWDALKTDVTPAARRAAVFGLLVVPGKVIDVILSQIKRTVDPTLALQLSFVVGLLAALVFYKFIKEPEVRER